MQFTTYDFIDSNKRKTIFLIVMFPVMLMVLTYLTLFLFEFFTGAAPDKPHTVSSAIAAVNPVIMQLLTLLFIVAVIWLCIAYFAGGDMVLNMAGAKPADITSHKEILRIVENVAITAGLQTPKVYIINDSSMNAFATGRNPKNASIGLTQGIIEKLDKPELEAVIAHEMAHIGNRDTTLMLIVILAMGACTLLGQILLRTSTRSRSRGKGAALIPLFGLVLLIYGYLLAPVLRLALSRRREYQADATAALITRDAQSLISALSKISGKSYLPSLEGNALMGDIFFENPSPQAKLTSSTSDFFSTHPSIEKRIAALQKMDGSSTDLDKWVK
jgi:heat shock protein HtpX